MFRNVQHVGDAVKLGAKVLTGGRVLSGLYYQPTVVTGIRPEMKMMNEETFGPVAPVLTFKTQDEAIRLANGSPFGLAALSGTDQVLLQQRYDLQAGFVAHRQAGRRA